MTTSGRSSTPCACPACKVPRRYPDRPPFDGVSWGSLSKHERALVTEWHSTDHARAQATGGAA